MNIIVVSVPCKIEWNEIDRVKKHVKEFQKKFPMAVSDLNTHVVYLPTFEGDVSIQIFNN